MTAQGKDPSDLFAAGFKLFKEAVKLYGEDAQREVTDLFRGAEKTRTPSSPTDSASDRDALLFSLLTQHGELLSDAVLELKAIRQIVTKLAE
jgi:hypothetical protein